MTDDKKTSVNYVRAWREDRGLTQAALARKVGVHRSTIKRLEDGRPYNQRLLEQVAAALGCRPGDLISRQPTRAKDIWKLLDNASEDELRRFEAFAKVLIEEKS